MRWERAATQVSSLQVRPAVSVDGANGERPICEEGPLDRLFRREVSSASTDDEDDDVPLGVLFLREVPPDCPTRERHEGPLDLPLPAASGDGEGEEGPFDRPSFIPVVVGGREIYTPGQPSTLPVVVGGREVHAPPTVKCTSERQSSRVYHRLLREEFWWLPEESRPSQFDVPLLPGNPSKCDVPLLPGSKSSEEQVCAEDCNSGVLGTRKLGRRASNSGMDMPETLSRSASASSLASSASSSSTESVASHATIHGERPILSNEEELSATLQGLMGLGVMVENMPNVPQRRSSRSASKRLGNKLGVNRPGALRGKSHNGTEEVRMDDVFKDIMQDILAEVVEDMLPEVAGEASEKMSLLSSDGCVIEALAAAACVSPIIAELRKSSPPDHEVPLPLVAAKVLSKVLRLCGEYAIKGQWDVMLLSSVASCEEEVEELSCAAEHLQLEHLQALCLGSLAELVKEKGPEKTSATLVAMQSALACWTVCSSVESIIALLDALARQAGRGHMDSLAAVLVYFDAISIGVRAAAMRAVGRLAPTDDATSIFRLQSSLCDDEVQVQLEALSAMAEVASKGNEAVIAALLKRCLEGVALARCGAVQALVRVSEPGHDCTIAVVVKCLSDVNASVRMAAVEALPYLVRKGDEQVALKLVKCLEDSDESVRQASVRVLPGVIEKTSEVVIGALLANLEHCSWFVSAASRQALKGLGLDEADIIDVLLARLSHKDAATRQSALNALTRVASKGSVRIIKGLLACLQHENADVRQIAIDGMAKFGKREEIAIRGVSALLTQPRNSLRKAALKALKLIASVGNEHALDEVYRHLKDGSTEVRLVALSALSQFANRNDSSAIESICSNLLDRDAALREAAAASFDKVVDKGHPQAIRTLLGLLDAGGDSHAPRTMARVIPKVAGCSEQSVQLLSCALQEQSRSTRSALFDACILAAHDKSTQRCDCWKSEINAEAAKGAGVRVTSRALGSCLLQPSVLFQDALSGALKTDGVCGSRVARILKTCMRSNSWAACFEMTEYLCENAVVVADADGWADVVATLLTSSLTKDGPANGNDCLHHPGCSLISIARPLVKESAHERPAKRSRLAKAGA